jgi:hypothetical protein
MAKRERAYLLPSVLSPVARREICISIPDDLGHILPFLAQLEHLANWYAWERNDAHDNDTVAAVWREIFDSVRQSIDEDTGCCNMAIKDIRMVDCVIEKQNPDDDTWSVVGSVADCVVVGIDAAIADGTIPGAPYPDYASPVTNATNTTERDVACGIADFASDYLIEKFNDSLDAIEAAVGLGVSIAKIAADVVDAIAGWAPVVGGIISAVKDVIEGSVTVTFAVIRASDTVDWRADVKCILYTYLKENSADFGATRDTVVDPFITDVKALSPAISPLFGRFLDGLDLKLFRKLAKISEDNEGECDDCDSWCVEFLFATDDYSEYWTQTAGSYLAGTGYRQIGSVDPNCAVYIYTNLPSGTNITRVQATYNMNYTGGNAGSGGTALIRGWSGASVTGSVLFQVNDDRFGSDFSNEWDGELDTVASILVNRTTEAHSDAHATLIGVVIAGTGENPFPGVPLC